MTLAARANEIQHRAWKLQYYNSQQLQTFWEHEQASTRLNFASKWSKGKILRAVKNFNGPFITPVIWTKSKRENACLFIFLSPKYMTMITDSTSRNIEIKS